MAQPFEKVGSSPRLIILPKFFWGKIFLGDKPFINFLRLKQTQNVHEPSPYMHSHGTQLRIIMQGHRFLSSDRSTSMLELLECTVLGI